MTHMSLPQAGLALGRSTPQLILLPSSKAVFVYFPNKSTYNVLD